VPRGATIKSRTNEGGVLLRADKSKLTRLRSVIIKWASSEGRDFPWRRADAETYQKIVVEVLLQRTTATAVGGLYEQFFARFPTWRSLAEAETSELEKLLRPIGLWRRRATSLIGLAQFATTHSGLFPKDPRRHASIPAVGQYVSNAILMFQHGRATPLLDVNMARVIERVVQPRRLADIRYDPWLQAAARWLVRGTNAEAANWAVLDFAALICKARAPLCARCPAKSFCAYFARSRASEVSTHQP
jgi:A/G-specific adenine glycosylase